MIRGTEKLCFEEWSLEHEGTYEDFIDRVCGGSKEIYRRLDKLRASEHAGEDKQGVDNGVLSEADAGEKHDRSTGLHGEKAFAETARPVPGLCWIHAGKMVKTNDCALAA